MAERPKERNTFDDLLVGHIERFSDRSLRRLLQDPEYASRYAKTHGHAP